MNDGRLAIDEAAKGLKEGRLAPWLGPRCLAADGVFAYPGSDLELCARICEKIAVPGRLRRDLGASAQWIETNKHRLTLTRVLDQIFAPTASSGPFYRWLAEIAPGLIVDEGFDALMADAFRDAGERFVEIQGVRRSGQKREEPWTLFYDEAGRAADKDDAPHLLYKPFGAARPVGNYLISDSDFVEVLAEIDIQTPIPESVIERRGNLGFLFLGCRFATQTNRIFAHQIAKRSKGPHYAVIDGELTKNEARFLEQEGIARIDLPLPEAFARLMRAA